MVPDPDMSINKHAPPPPSVFMFQDRGLGVVASVGVSGGPEMGLWTPGETPHPGS